MCEPGVKKLCDENVDSATHKWKAAHSIVTVGAALRGRPSLEEHILRITGGHRVPPLQLYREGLVWRQISITKN